MKSSANTVSLLLDVGRIVRVRMERELPASLTRCETLRLLEQEKSPTMRTIADHFKITAPSATAIVNELVGAKLVVRSENSEDRREVHLHLTALGKKTQRTLTAIRKRVIARVLSPLSDADHAKLNAILNTIITEADTR